jgi:hypothetical protein
VMRMGSATAEETGSATAKMRNPTATRARVAIQHSDMRGCANRSANGKPRLITQRRSRIGLFLLPRTRQCGRVAASGTHSLPARLPRRRPFHGRGVGRAFTLRLPLTTDA